MNCTDILDSYRQFLNYSNLKKRRTESTLEYINEQIAKMKAIHDGYEEQDRISRGRAANRISQLYYTKSNRFTDPDQKLRLQRANAFWLGRALENHHPTAFKVFADALDNPDDSRNKVKIEALEKLKKNSKKLEYISDLSDKEIYLNFMGRAFDFGDKEASWKMCLALHKSIKKDEGNDQGIDLEIIKERNIPLNEEGIYLTMAIAALGRHTLATSALFLCFENADDITYLHKILNHDTKDIMRVNGWIMTKAFDKNPNLKDDYTILLEDDKIAHLRSAAMQDDEEALILKRKLVSQYSLRKS